MLKKEKWLINLFAGKRSNSNKSSNIDNNNSNTCNVILAIKNNVIIAVFFELLISYHKRFHLLE